MIEAQISLENYRENCDKINWDIYNKYESPKNWLLNKKILDIGCFVGGKAECLSDNGAKEVIGIDLSLRGISVAKKYEKENLIFFNKSSSDLINDYYEYFDTIVSYTVFEHIETHLLNSVIDDAYSLLKIGGKFFIVFNHYGDRYGSHMANHIYFSHPTLIFNEIYLNEFCNKRLRYLQGRNEMGYYPKNFVFSDLHNSDSYMALNKICVLDFIEILKRSRFKKYRFIPYSKTTLMKIFSIVFPDKEIFRGSYIYVLEK